VDVHGRGHAGDIDPADQWVFNPDTGNYELRMPPAADEPRGSYGDRSTTPRPRRPASASASSPARPSAPGGSEKVPSQRSRRAVGSGHDSSPPSRRKPKPKPSGKQKVLRWGGGTLCLLLVSGCTAGYFVYQHFNNNIDKVDVGIDNPATSGEPVNILVIGSDARTGDGNKGYGDAESVGHADTTLLLHVSKDRSNATVLSIPRDMITDVPDCPTKRGDGSEKVIPGQQGVRFNESLGQRGRDPGCTWLTVEELVGVEINHFMMADFNAVKTLSTAVGGVEVCVAKDIDDKKSKLRLDAGKNTVQGEEALAFVRTRSSVGFGSDLDRIKLQQQFLGSMFRQMKSSETLSSPSKLLGLAEAATDALTVDTGIGSVKKLAGLAQNLQQVNPENITFVTVPVVDNPEEEIATTVVLNEAKANPLFEKIRNDRPLAGPKKGKDTSEKKEEKEEKAEKAPASEVRVDVFNGGGPIGAAQQTVDWLQNTEDVPLSTNAGNASANQDRTTLEYGPDQAGQAATLADMMGLPGSALKKRSEDAGDGVPMTLILGKDYSAPGTPVKTSVQADEALDEVQNINGGDENVCAE
jgi:LCP family protein required for cell wall assembly